MGDLSIDSDSDFDPNGIEVLTPPSPKRAKTTMKGPGETRETVGEFLQRIREPTVAVAGTQLSVKPTTKTEHGPPIASEHAIILVGEEREELFVHTHLLTSSSKHFAKLLHHTQQKRVETTQRTFSTIKFAEVNTHVFKIYAKWLYTGTIHLAKDTTTQASNRSRLKVIWGQLSLCYSLSVSLEAPSFGDAVIDTMIENMTELNDSPLDLAKRIFPHTTEGSVHRRLCRDIVVNTWDRVKLNLVWKEDFPPEFKEMVFDDISHKLGSAVRRQTVAQFLGSTSRTPCKYHEHTRLRVPCYKEAFLN